MPAPIQTAFTAGELDPLLAAREDIRFYYNGAELIRNLLVIPQGGLRRRPGSEYLARVRTELTKITPSSASAPNGGTASTGIDGDPDTLVETSQAIGTTDPYVVLSVDLGSAQDVSAVDVVDVALTEGESAEFFVQWSTDNSSWTTLGPALNVSAEARTRRRAAPPGEPIEARYWRLVRIGSTDLEAATAQVADMLFWVESGTAGTVRLIPFSFSTTQAYILVATEGNLDVYADGQLTASIGIPHTSDQLAVLNWTQSLDTLLLFHADVPVHRVFRQGSDAQWDSREQEFTNVPQFDFGDSPGGVDEIQQIDFDGYQQGDTFNISLLGEVSDSIAYGANSSETATRIQNALRGFKVTSADGITVVGDSSIMEVTFGGADGKRDWPELDVRTLVSSEGAVFTATLRQGQPPGEDVMSPTRGYPRCGTFYQGRLWMGGFRSRPQTLIGSVAGDFFNLSTGSTLDDRGIDVTIDTDQVSTIFQLFAGSTLQIFTGAGEFYVPSEPITPTNIAIKQATRHGAEEGLRVAEVDGSTLFVQRLGSAINEMLINEASAQIRYDVQNISLLASHLIMAPIDIALRRQVRTDEADLLLMVNSDGTGTALTTLRSQNVTAFSRVETAGTLKAVGVEEYGAVHWVVEREIDGETVRYLERWNDNLLLDAGVAATMDAETFVAAASQTAFTWSFDNPASGDLIGVRLNGARLVYGEDYTVDLDTKTVTLAAGAAEGDIVRIASMVSTITGLDHLEGETVQVIVDGSPAGAATVAGGEITLDVPADTSYQVGIDFEVRARTMPLKVNLPDGTSVGKRKRIYEVVLSLYETQSLAVAANGGDFEEIIFREFGDELLDRPAPEFTGVKEVAGLAGWTEEGQVEITQTSPGKLTLRAIAMKVKV